MIFGMVCIVKRIVHYSLLALVLLGVLFLCCVIGGYDGILEGVKDFPPRTEDWGLKPELLWNHRFQIWEMPLIGFAGYLPVGVECAAVTAWISPMLIGVGKRAGGAV